MISTRTKSFFQIIFIFFLSRILIGLFVYLGHTQRPFLQPVPGGWEGVANWWLNPWTTYDSQWFIDIAINGYREQTSAFYPLYPLLLKLAGTSEATAALLGVILSNLSFAVALFFLYELTRMDFKEQVARASVWALAFFPTTAFFSAVYTESFFLLLLLVSFYLARRHRWLPAGMLGLLAALTRNSGVIVFVALALEYIVSKHYNWRRFRVANLISIFLPLLGFVGVQLYFWHAFGSLGSGIKSQELYHRVFGWPWEPVWKDFFNVVTFQAREPVTFLNLFVTILTLVFVVKYRKILRPAYGLLMLGIILMHLCYPRIIPPYTIGAARYMSTTFPFVQLIAFAFTRLSLPRILKPAAAGLYFCICILFSYYFGLKWFLG